MATHADSLYQHLIVTAERKFWRCVESGDLGIARRDEQLMRIAYRRGNWVRFVKPPASDGRR
jgi:hypothetical protein